MKVTINGEEHLFDVPVSIQNLINRFNLDPAKIAIEQNLAIVPCSEYAQSLINDGDRIEIVQFIGGG